MTEKERGLCEILFKILNLGDDLKNKAGELAQEIEDKKLCFDSVRVFLAKAVYENKTDIEKKAKVSFNNHFISFPISPIEAMSFE